MGKFTSAWFLLTFICISHFADPGRLGSKFCETNSCDHQQPVLSLGTTLLKLFPSLWENQTTENKIQSKYVNHLKKAVTLLRICWSWLNKQTHISPDGDESLGRKQTKIISKNKSKVYWRRMVYMFFPWLSELVRWSNKPPCTKKFRLMHQKREASHASPQILTV